MRTYAHAALTMGLTLFFWEPSMEYPNRIPPYLYLFLATYLFSILPDKISGDPNDGQRYDISHSAVTGSLLVIPTVILRILTGPLIFSGLGEFHGFVWFGYLSVLIAGISWIIHSLLDSFWGSGVKLLYPFSGSTVFGTGIDPKGMANGLLTAVGLALTSYRLADTISNLETGLKPDSSYLYVQLIGAFWAILLYWILLKAIGKRARNLRTAKVKAHSQAQS